MSNFPGRLVGLLMLAQYFGSNGVIINTGFNHTLLIQLFICFISIPFFYLIDKKKIYNIFLILILFLLFSISHYEVVIRINDGVFTYNHIWMYVKHFFYLYVFLALYFYFEAKDFLIIIRFAKFIFLLLFIEVLFFLTFKALGFSGISILFESAEGRFAGIFLMHNTLVSLFTLFVMSYIIFFGTKKEKWFYITSGVLLIIVAGERSAFLGLILLIFSNVLFSRNKNSDIVNNKIKLFFTITILISALVIIYTFIFRGYDIQSVGQFLRPFVLRLYFSYMSLVHLFESGNPIFGFGGFSDLLPYNYADIYSDYIENFVNIVTRLLGDSEGSFIRSFHDSSNVGAFVNAHNTFVHLFYKFGFFFIGFLFYFIYLLGINFIYVKQEENKNILPLIAEENLKSNSFFFQIPSLTFIICSFPSLFFLSLDAYLLLVVIAFGLIGSFVRQSYYE